MAETTSTEFRQWQQYFRQELETPKREELYLAQIAAECRRFVTRNPGNVRIDQFILPLAPKHEERVAAPSKSAVTARTATSKAYWFGLTGTRKGRA